MREREQREESTVCVCEQREPLKMYSVCDCKHERENDIDSTSGETLQICGE